MVAFHSMGASFMAAGIIPAYDLMAEEYEVPVESLTYLTATQVYMSPITCCFPIQCGVAYTYDQDPAPRNHTRLLETN